MIIGFDVFEFPKNHLDEGVQSDIAAEQEYVKLCRDALDMVDRHAAELAIESARTPQKRMRR